MEKVQFLQMKSKFKMKTYLVQYTLLTYQYMEDGKTKEPKTILIEAENEEKAKETLKKYWENKSDSFSTSYGTDDIIIIPSINQTEVLKY